MLDNKKINGAMTIKLDNEYPEYPKFEEGIRRAPDRGFRLSKEQTKIALRNALRYVPEELHEKLAPEFMEELKTKGRIYAYRYRPEGRMHGKPINEYKGKCLAGKAFQVMIENNLDFDVALYPYELITYGETGAVCQNWLQYRLIKKYLEELTEDQTLVVESGHPLGLFPSKPTAPRVINTNSMMIGMFDNQDDWEIAEEMGVANYGQMTAGGWMYIGPQGIVHGTFNTILGAGRKYLGIAEEDDLKGHTFVSSGLGGMSGAQPKAANIANAVGIFAEVDLSRIQTRLDQGWVDVCYDNLDDVFKLANEKIEAKETISIAYHGNIVDLLEAAVEKNFNIDLLSDQTSCHNVYNGGYCPAGLCFDERTEMLHENREEFIKCVDESLVRHFKAIKALTERGAFFFDYGNSFLKAMYDAGIKELSKNGIDEKDGFIWPSYVEDLMGPMLFDFGYGPFRWVCLSGKQEDLDATDMAAMECIDPNRRYQDRDNWIWIRDAKENKLVVGTKARILYQDCEGRMKIALKFNEMIREGKIGPVMLGRDHHDVSGTDSPYRETSNIYDGSAFTADMAIQNVIGDSFRGATWVSIHNGGGVGWGEVINGGFGMLLDGSAEADRRLRMMLYWDVNNGIARRSWARNTEAVFAIKRAMQQNPGLIVTLPNFADDSLIDKLDL